MLEIFLWVIKNSAEFFLMVFLSYFLFLASCASAFYLARQKYKQRCSLRRSENEENFFHFPPESRLWNLAMNVNIALCLSLLIVAEVKYEQQHSSSRDDNV